MPPIPILVLLGAVGLGVYLIIGSVIATFWLYTFYDVRDPEIRRVAKGQHRAPFWWAIALWPGLIAAAIVVAVGAAIYFSLLWAPIWVAKHVSQYIATAIQGPVPDPEPLRAFDYEYSPALWHQTIIQESPNVEETA